MSTSGHRDTAKFRRMSRRQGDPMPRTILPEAQIHPALREKIASYRGDVLKEVQAAVAANEIVVVGMRMNPFPKKARKALDAAGLAYKYRVRQLSERIPPAPRAQDVDRLADLSNG